MFTGLVEKVGILAGRSGDRLRIRVSEPFRDLVRGESIAVNGCCLTLERELPDRTMEFFTLAETLSKTNLGELATGSPVNLERALRLGDRLGGHIVSGHIDATGRVRSFRQIDSGDWELKVELPPELAPELVVKWSISIDGVSLTVVEVGTDWFTVCLIPVTRSDTALAARRPGIPVNLEGDVIGKYVRRQLEFRSGGAAPSPGRPGITMETLREAGFL